MIHHGYVRGLKRQAEDLGYSVVRYEMLRCSVNECNPTGVIVIEKGGTTEWKGLCDPLSKKQLTEYSDCYFAGIVCCHILKLAVFPACRDKTRY